MATNSLVSYSAPSGDTQTFYVSNLDSTATSGTAGAFTGGAATQASVSYANINTITNVTAATASAWFEFYTVSSNDATNSTGNDIVGVDSGTAPVFTNTNSNVGNDSTNQTERNALQKDFVDTLAEHVFGSREGADLFNNQSAVKTAWDTAEAATVTAANSSMDSAADGANTGDASAIAAAATLSVGASKELTEAILVSKYARFGLTYNSSITGSSSAFVTGTTQGITPTSGGSGTGAKVSVIMTNTTTINAVMIYDDASDSAAPITGSGYAKGDSLIITDPSEATNIITIASLNSVQAAMLNGNLDNSSVPTTCPLEAGDKIRVKYGINSAVGQTNTNGAAVTFRQSYYVDYHLQ
jgi:hypothetical protein